MQNEIKSAESMPKIHAQAYKIIGACRMAGIKAEVAGGVFKGKRNPHDIDIVIEAENYTPVLRELLIHCSGVIKDTQDAKTIPETVEFYIATPEHFPRLLEALRSSTWDCIRHRKMSGVRYSKLVLEAHHTY